jgi:RNA polymerase sigma-70 factor (ECF subfamily)
MNSSAQPADEPQLALEARLAAEAPGLRAYLRRVAGVGARSAELDDLAQAALERALRYRKSYDPARPLGAWLRTIALRVVLDQRAARVRDAASAPSNELAAREDATVEHRDELARVLAPLSDVERDVLVRFHGRGETVQELALALQLPEGTVKSHLHRARRKLAERGRTGEAR